MNEWTHLVIGVPEDNSTLRQAQLLEELTDGMEVIAACTNAHDAEIVRAAFQRTNAAHVYSVIEITERIARRT